MGEEELAKFRALPEYRKAKKELLIKPRPPPANKSSVLAQKLINDKNKIGLRQDGHTVSTKVTGPAPDDDPPRAIHQPQKKPQSFKYMLENGNENVEKKLPAVDANAPKFEPESNNKPIQLHHKPIYHDSMSLLQRNGTNVVEANTKYVKEAATGQYSRQNLHRNNIVKQPPPVKPFVVLNAPAKTRNKQHWLGPTTIYDSYIY